MSIEARFGGLRLIDLTPVYFLSFEEGWSPRDFFGVQRAIIAKGARRFALISEVRHVRPIGALERKVLGEALDRLHSEIDSRVVVSVVVTESAIMRGVMRAVNWVHPVLYPIIPVSSFEEAEAEAVERLRAEGVVLDVAIRDALSALGRRRHAGVGT